MESLLVRSAIKLGHQNVVLVQVVGLLVSEMITGLSLLYSENAKLKLIWVRQLLMLETVKLLAKGSL